MKIKKNGKVINLTESDFKKLTVSLLKEQTTHSSETWDNQKKAKENKKYCVDYAPDYAGPKFYEGQYCNVNTKWFDWESGSAVKKTNQGSGGIWKCGVGCIVTLKEK